MAQGAVRKVTALPVLDQAMYPSLVEFGALPSDHVFFVTQSPLTDVAEEVVLGMLITAAYRNGGWKPVGGAEKWNLYHEYLTRREVSSPPVWEAEYSMEIRDLIEEVEFEGKSYLVALPALTRIVQLSKVTARRSHQTDDTITWSLRNIASELVWNCVMRPVGFVYRTACRIFKV